MPQMKFDINQRGPRPMQRPKPLRPQHPAAVRQQMLRDEAKKERAMPAGMVRVKATNRLGDGIIAKFIRHGNRAFNKDGYAEWPMDQFTNNRVRDGDVTIEAAGAERGQGEQRQGNQEQRHEHERRRTRETPRNEQTPS